MALSSQHNRAAPYLFLAPFLLLFAAFIAYPLVKSIGLSFHQSYGPQTTEYVGFDNFRFLFGDSLFWTAARNTTIFAAVCVLTQMPCALGLALLLNSPRIRGRAFFRLLLFSPSLVGLTFATMILGIVFEKRTGLLNVTLHSFFGTDPDLPWLEDYIMFALVLSAMWLYVGFNMVYFLAALQNVSTELIDAAKVDGADRWHVFLHVTIPAIAPVARFVVLLSLIGSFQLFELPYLLLGGSGPDNRGLTLVMYLYQQGFEAGDLGYASAIGWILALALGAFAIAQHTVGRRD